MLYLFAKNIKYTNTFFSKLLVEENRIYRFNVFIGKNNKIQEIKFENCTSNRDLLSLNTHLCNTDCAVISKVHISGLLSGVC